jgi:hypothetical protein
MELDHLFSMRQSARRPPVPHDLVWVLSLNFLPQEEGADGKSSYGLANP